eukprot:TRINITY_DN776_c1_g1_i2.p1 TRINITY_DN776_c1_g1~~TRINITY_DN776_c1_g1_i2.p1  ORF type:complete len:294 (+),score=94.05 TRINITY_DN776_c1_g1_i2:176-1057(+)
MGDYAVPFGVWSGVWFLASCAWLAHLVRFRSLTTKLHRLLSLYPIVRFVWAVTMAICDGEYYEYEDFAVNAYPTLTTAGIAEGLVSAVFQTVFWGLMLLCAAGFCVRPAGVAKPTMIAIAGIALLDGVFALMRINESISTGYADFTAIATLLLRIAQVFMLIRHSKATACELSAMAASGAVSEPNTNSNVWQIPILDRSTAAVSFNKLATLFVLANIMWLGLTFAFVIFGYATYSEMFWLAEALVWEIIYFIIFIGIVYVFCIFIGIFFVSFFSTLCETLLSELSFGRKWEEL